MKRFICSVGLAISLIVGAGCTPRHTIVKLYSYDGDLIQQWGDDGRVSIDSCNSCKGSFSFYYEDKYITLHDGIIVIEA